MGFINKLNLIGGDFDMSLKMIQEELSPNAIAITYPIGKEHELTGFVDLVTMNLRRLRFPHILKPGAMNCIQFWWKNAPKLMMY